MRSATHDASEHGDGNATFRRLRTGFEELVRPSDLKGPTNERVLRVAQRVRLGVTIAFAVAMLFIPAFELEKRLVLSALAFAYALTSALLESIGARHPRFPAGILTPMLGIATVFTLTIVFPEIYTAMLLCYILGITFYTCVSGVRLGLVLSAIVIPCALLGNQLAPTDDAVSTFTMVMFVLLLPSVAVTIEALTQERRRTAARLARLHDALRAVTVTPDLEETLDSIVESARDALGAGAAGILLREDDHLVVAAPTGATAGFRNDDVIYYTSRELAMGDDSPLARSMLRLEAVTVVDVHSDPEFPQWSKLWGEALRDAGFRSLVAVPLHTGTKVIGVLNAVFERPGAIARDELMLLETYAEQVSLVIARSQAYERERQAAEQLAETDRLRSEFLSMVSHELRTPLTVVKGFTDTMLLHWNQLSDTRRRELLTRVAGNADELTRLVNQLLDFARMDAGQMRLALEPMRVMPAVDRLIRDVAPIMSEHPLAIAIPPDAIAVADSDAFGHIVTNLLTNAARFSPAGSQIEIAARRDGAYVVISVADHGLGIARDEQDRVFERFYQSSSTPGPRRGTGIGLTVARYFTELQGGRIWVDSQVGEGSTFSFTLPMSDSPTTVVDHPEAESVA